MQQEFVTLAGFFSDHVDVEFSRILGGVQLEHPFTGFHDQVTRLCPGQFDGCRSRRIGWPGSDIVPEAKINPVGEPTEVFAIGEQFSYICKMTPDTYLTSTIFPDSLCVPMRSR